MKDGSPTTRTRTITEVRASLARNTEQLRDALERLELGARAKLDVGRRIASKGPGIYIAGFVVGLLLGMITVRSRRRHAHY